MNTTMQMMLPNETASVATTAPLIVVDHVSMSYGSPPRTILNRIDLEIQEGEFVCLLGQTGCGKSTLLRLVLGSEQPADGRILIDGREHRQPVR